MNSKIIVTFLACLLIFSYSKAQTSKAFYESVIKNKDRQEKVPIVLPHVEPEDMMWCKTVWRELILSEKMNLPLYYPTVPMDGRKSLVHVLIDGIEESFKAAYDEDELQTPVTIDEIKRKLGGLADTIINWNSETEKMDTIIPSVDDNAMHTDEVKRMLLKELWYFNKRTSKLEFRIIAVCPVRIFIKEGEEEKGPMSDQLFWVDYGEFRDLLAKQKVYNSQNDALSLSFDDIFLKRYFSSRIIKESNFYDNRSIQSYSTGMDGILESDRIRDKIFNLEQDLWEY